MLQLERFCAVLYLLCIVAGIVVIIVAIVDIVAVVAVVTVVDGVGDGVGVCVAVVVDAVVFLVLNGMACPGHVSLRLLPSRGVLVRHL